MQGLAEDISGEALWRRGKALLRVFAPHLEEGQGEELFLHLRVLRREANRRHPPRTQAASPTSLGALRWLWGEAQRKVLPARQREALEILAVAFATVSRAGEVVALELHDVAEDGSWVRVRPKISAATWRRLSKKVDNAPGLPVRGMLVKRREMAARRGRLLLYPDEGGGVRTTAASRRRLERWQRP